MLTINSIFVEKQAQVFSGRMIIIINNDLKGKQPKCSAPTPELPALFLLSRYAVQSPLELIDYSLSSSLVFQSATPITGGMLKLKFTFGDINALVAQPIIEGSLYKVFYLSRAFQMCIEKDTQGIILYNVYPASHYELQISSTTVTVNGNAMGFDSSSSKCPYTSFLGIESFSWSVAELIIDSTLATAISSSLASYSQLPMESCQTEASPGVCQTCISRYTLNSPNCDPLAYGYETANTCYAPFQYDNQANKCVDGTGAYSVQNISGGNPRSNLDFGTSSWTAQFYLHVTPNFQDTETTTEQKILRFGKNNKLNVDCTTVQQFATGRSYAYINLHLQVDTHDVKSQTVNIPYGEWLLVTVQANAVTLVYTLKVQNHGTASLTGYPAFQPDRVEFKVRGNQMAQLVKELLVWNTAIADTPQITTHKCSFDHGVDFLPYLQYNLNFIRTSTDTLIVDERGVAPSMTIANLDTLTVGEAIEKFPPIAPLPGTMLYSDIANSVACVECMPKCQACSNIFTCTTCSSGTKIGGICMANTLSANSGNACSTAFTYDTSELTQINRYLTTQIKEASSTQQISYSAKLIYPDSTQRQISDLSSFTVPNYHVVDLTSFGATVRLTFTLNSVATNTDLGVITLAQPAKTPPNCMSCMPNCSVCSDLYVCQACSSGALIGGLCIVNTLSASSGDACSTSFSFDTSDFTAINTHINTQLGASAQQVSFTSAKVVYPDSSSKPISDVSSFTIDNYHVIDQTSFSATVKLSFTVNGVAKQEDLTTITVNQPAKTPPNCMSCMPNCSECSNIYVCLACSNAATLVGGLCFSNAVAPSTGTACSTAFSFDTSQFATINSHINTQLGVASTTQQVSFTSSKLVYPDNSEKSISDISSFTVDNYYVLDLISFPASLYLTFTVNGVSKSGELTQISMTQPAKTPPNCMQCTPNCSECSDLYVCEACSSGTLVGGVCLTNTVSPSSGAACSASFSFDIAELTTINTHINTQLAVASSTQQVAYSSAKLVYPDNSYKTVSDISSFIIPNHYVLGLTTFQAILRLSLSVNGQTKEGDLPSVTISQPANTPPNCMTCLPNCSECSNLYGCITCSSGSLIGGLCITNTLSPPSGQAGQSSFSFDISETNTFNTHINTQLGAASSTTQVSFTYLKLTYPDSSVVYVTDPSSFVPPVYKVEGATSYTVSAQLVFNVNGESKKGDLARINLNQAAYSPPNVCGCRLNTECNPSTRKCTCEQGYEGTHCSFTVAELQTQQTQVTSQIENISSTLGSSTSNSEALSQLSLLTSKESAVTESTALQTTTLLSQIVSQASTQDQLSEVAQVESNLIPKVDGSSTQSTNIGQQIKSVMEQMVTKTISTGSNLSISTPNIVASVADFDPNSPPAPTSQEKVQITFPSGISSPCPDSRLFKVFYQTQLFRDLTPSGFVSTSDTVSLDFYSCGGVKQPLTNLQNSIVLEFPVSQDDPTFYQRVQQLLNEGRNPADYVSCSFHDTQSNSISQEGCSLIELTSEFVKCGCNHMTDFLVLIRTDDLVATSSHDYGFSKALSELKSSNLGDNKGFIFAIVYTILYLVVCLILQFIDKRRKFPQFFPRLFAFYSGGQILEHFEEEDSPQRRGKKQKIPTKSTKIRPMPHPNRNDSMTPITMNKSYEMQEEQPIKGKGQKIVYQKRASKNAAHEGSPEASNKDNQLSILIRPKDQGKTPLSATLQGIVERRILSILNSDPRRSCSFCKLFKEEIRSHNQLINIAKRVSYLIPPYIRVAFIFLAILLELTLCAIFIHFSHSDHSFGMNLLMSIGSFCLAMWILLVVGLLFNSSSQMRANLRWANNTNQIQKTYKGMKKKILLKAIACLVFFLVVSAILLLQILCFTQVASHSMLEDWMISSVLVIAMDFVLFELAAGVLFGIFALCYWSCRSTKSMLRFLVAFEFYRVHRNLVQV